MIIEIKKGQDGPPSLTCIRADGSRTWARMHRFFPQHDLTHVAVESVMGFDRAFFGLVASGWEIDDFSRPGAADQMPEQALWTENLVAFIERGAADDSRQLNEYLRTAMAETTGNPCRISSQQLELIHQLRAAFFTRWANTPPGEKLAIAFPAEFGEPN